MLFRTGSVVRNLPAKQEMQVRSLDLEDPLEEVMATHFSIVAWELHGQRSLAGYIQTMGWQRVRHESD